MLMLILQIDQHVSHDAARADCPGFTEQVSRDGACPSCPCTCIDRNLSRPFLWRPVDVQRLMMQ